MRTFLRSSIVVTALTALPTLALAHPGHDGGEVTWDFSHLAAHPYATMGWMLAIGAAAWLVTRMTAPRTKRASVEKSEPSR